LISHATLWEVRSVNITWLVGASLVIGMTTIAAQLIVPFAAQLLKTEERGKVVGMVMVC